MDIIQLNYWSKVYTRDSNKEVSLKFLHNSQNPIEFVINKAKQYSIKNYSFLILYEISQKPDTNEYILVQNNLANHISENEKIDNFIHKRQLQIKAYSNVVLEWMPYSQFNQIKETDSTSKSQTYQPSSVTHEDVPKRIMSNKDEEGDLKHDLDVLTSNTTTRNTDVDDNEQDFDFTTKFKTHPVSGSQKIISKTNKKAKSNVDDDDDGGSNELHLES
ncbi:kinase-like domain-containing protein [Rhizophagus clarus]|uniref:Kinase-like domain-containing protein n=1 Tax=Rhizophagus clarus TaxID=94130 RepID=A0A8H3L974_9GLOM|nr:kinase-like domain-containing protein [Rhizophagus clarus]